MLVKADGKGGEPAAESLKLLSTLARTGDLIGIQYYTKEVYRTSCLRLPLGKAYGILVTATLCTIGADHLKCL